MERPRRSDARLQVHVALAKLGGQTIDVPEGEGHAGKRDTGDDGHHEEGIAGERDDRIEQAIADQLDQPDDQDGKEDEDPSRALEHGRTSVSVSRS